MLSLAATKPDIILMDVKMPRLDGFEAAKRLKDDPETKDIPLILLSARAQQEDLEEGYQSGADYYLTKPVTISQIMDTLEECLG